MKRNFWQLLVVSIFSVILTLMAVFYVTNRYVGNGIYAVRLLRTMHLLKRDFNGETNDKLLYEGAIKGMVDAVKDPYTTYLNAKDFNALYEMTEGKFGGVGIVFGKRDNNYVVISALEDNPGAKAGIQGGEIILAVDGKSTKDMNMEEVANNIRGPKGTEVTLTLQDKNGEQREVTVTRDDIKNVSVGGTLLEGTSIGYIRISMFNENTGEDFAKKYQELEAQGMQATILDLRNNPGGTLRDGVAVAKFLVPKGPIVSVIDSHGRKYTESSSLEKVKYPLAVLVNHGTASAAEIVSGAVKDTKAGRLFGTKTFGKGSVQQVYRLSKDTGVKITIAKYYTPSNVSIHNVGIEPDEVVELPAQPTEDNQLMAAKQYLLEQLAK